MNANQLHPTTTPADTATGTAATAAPTMTAAQAPAPTPSAASEATATPELTDEQILTQMQAIKDEEAMAHPLVDEAIGMEELLKEYENGDPSYNLEDTHDRMRRSRGDGNCFYRALAFAWFERILLAPSKPELHQKALETMRESENLMISAGFESLAYEDFYQVCIDTLKALPTMLPEQLLKIFQTDELSNSIVMHFRLVASAYLKLHKDEYEPFLDLGQTMNDFCSMYVEAMGRESEEMMLIAMTKALNISIEVAYLSANDSEEVNFLPFLPENPPYMPPLVLLYRPGHYDILYRKSHCLDGVV
ncbi:hypothetical protein BGZ73_006014 [Actinomortierella ambigua]|nr:hypothetical protein BGZ73_006014 [Actinomortierella ambigua]